MNTAWISLAALALMLPQGIPNGPQDLFPIVLDTVSRNVKITEDLLPDFLCNEKVTSTRFKSGKQEDQKVVESIFSVRQSRENREILSIDGKAARKGARMPQLPVNIRGSFNYMINTTFSPRALEWYEFVPSPLESGKFKIQFETKRDQKAMTWDIDGDQLLAHDTGLAWIDTASMQVTRLERNMLNLGGNETSWKVTINQAPFTIGEREFWLPTMFLTEITERDPRRTGTFVAEYSNCKKFTAEITIRPVK